MTPQEAINKLNSLKQYYNDKNEDGYVGFDDEDNEAIDMAIKTLDQTRWIPVSERLPEEDGMYLISTCMNCIDTCLFYKDDDGYLWVDYEESVIAWMPLPEPYRGERTEE